MVVVGMMGLIISLGWFMDSMGTVNEAGQEGGMMGRWKEAFGDAKDWECDRE